MVLACVDVVGGGVLARAVLSWVCPGARLCFAVVGGLPWGLPWVWVCSLVSAVVGVGVIACAVLAWVWAALVGVLWAALGLGVLACARCAVLSRVGCPGGSAGRSIYNYVHVFTANRKPKIG